MTISDEDLEQLVRRNLEVLFPMRGSGGGERDVIASRGRHKRWPLAVATAASAAAVVAIAAAVSIVARGSNTPQRAGSGTSGQPPTVSVSIHAPATSSTTSRSTPALTKPLPAWATSCLPHAAQDSQFQGMRYPDARTSANRRDVRLVIIGQAGRCYPLPSVAFHNPLLVLLDQRDRILATRTLVDHRSTGQH